LSDRIYKLQRQGNSYYLCLPKLFVSERMLANGVYIRVERLSGDELILKVRAADGQHTKDHKKGGKHTS